MKPKTSEDTKIMNVANAIANNGRRGTWQVYQPSFYPIGTSKMLVRVNERRREHKRLIYLILPRYAFETGYRCDHLQVPCILP